MPDKPSCQKQTKPIQPSGVPWRPQRGQPEFLGGGSQRSDGGKEEQLPLPMGIFPVLQSEQRLGFVVSHPAWRTGRIFHQGCAREDAVTFLRALAASPAGHNSPGPPSLPISQTF